MSDSRPNIVLIMTDQQRGDCLGIAGHPVLQTPNLDELGASGTHFTAAYSAHPQCIPARRTLMTGRSAHGHGVYFNMDRDLPFPTLPGELTKAGYHTHLCGKLHLHPKRKLYGFMSADWADAPHDNKEGNWTGDYGLFLKQHGFHEFEAGMGHGMHVNGWTSRPWHLEERFHFTNWVTDSALRFMERRDPTCPFFLKVSYHQPHQPCTPPQAYWDRYINAELPEPVNAEWSRKLETYTPGQQVNSWQTALSPALMQQYRAGYYGCINHIDDQIGRLLRWLPDNTVVLFCSDHGEMLGDHQWLRKTRALDASARIPFLLNCPQEMGLNQGNCDRPIELMDIMPTFLELAGADIPDSVEGQSLVPILKEQASTDWRECVHGEMALIGGEPTGMQYLTDGKRKFIWEPGLGRELFFDLEADPDECRPIDPAGTRADEVTLWRNRLIEKLSGREEGFVENDTLVKLDGPTRLTR